MGDWGSESVLFHLIPFHDNHRTAWDFPHLAFHFVAGVTALKVGGEGEPAFALDVNDADSDAVFLLAFQHDRLRRADAELFAVVGWRDTLVDWLIQHVDKLLVPYLVAVETQQTFLVLALVDGDHDVGQQIIFPILENWSPFNFSFAVALEACCARPYPRLARQRVRLVLLSDHDLGQFDDLVFQRHGQFVPVGVSRVGDCRRLVGNVREGQFVPAPSGYRQREMSLRVGDNAHAVLFNSDADVLHAVTPLIDDVAYDLRLCLPRYYDEREQSGDDGFLVHFTFLKFNTTSELQRCQVMSLADSLSTSYSWISGGVPPYCPMYIARWRSSVSA